MNKDSYSTLHTHTMFSNLRLKDAVIKPNELVEESFKLGLNGLVVTDHETLSAHLKISQYYNQNKERFGDFKIGFGNEIYLVDREIVEKNIENKEKVTFNHFILIAKNQHGYEGIRKLSTLAWSNMFNYRGMDRVPTYYDDLSDLMNEYRGDIIGSSACLGGIIPGLIKQYHETQSNNDKKAIINEIKRLQSIFGEGNFYLEIQPPKQEEQALVNSYLINIAQSLDIDLIVTTDAHYLSEAQKQLHKIYLQSSDGEREVDGFYDTTYLMDSDLLKSYFPVDQQEVLENAISNTNKIMDSIEDIEFEHKPIVPDAHIPEFDNPVLHDYADINWNKYKTIQYYSQSKHEVDRYYLKLILDGMVKFNQKFDDYHLSRVDTELDVVKEIGDYFGMPMSSYFILVLEMINIMWEHSLVGVARGSASAFYLNYLVGIVQINGLEHDLPYWRFLNKDRKDSLPDIDVDAEGRQRDAIITSVKKVFGEQNVINSGTFTTEGTRSAVISGFKGIGLTMNDAQNALDILPDEYDLKSAFFGNDKKELKPVQKFIDEVNQHEGLQEVLLGIEGLVSGRGSHASGVFVMPDGYVNHFGAMKTSSGLTITQFDAHDVESVGGIKIDFLSIDALDRIRESMDLLLDNKKIEWQGNLKKTFDKYLHPDVIDLEDKRLYDIINSGTMPHIFQFSSPVGGQGIQKVQPQTFEQLGSTNSLIRMTTTGEQLIDKYIRFRDNPDDWDNEMIENGLNESERNVLHNLLDKTFGINDTQEMLMIEVMDKNISSFTLGMANKMRKAVAKKSEKLQEQQKEIFYKNGLEAGTRKEMLDYVWNFNIVPQFGYAFSSPWE